MDVGFLNPLTDPVVVTSLDNQIENNQETKQASIEEIVDTKAIVPIRQLNPHALALVPPNHKDQWKTLVHTVSISPQQKRGEPVPQDLLDRVLAAHSFWSQNQSKQHGIPISNNREGYTDAVDALPLMLTNVGNSGRSAVSSLMCLPILAVELCREHLVGV
ncbi:hypothetical protein L1987_00739 [Smallanthus sonchifolius]|uniref:Uncharacterized protein n=1 Tax=Smallanthus sonchifolius TaxID=185202 RepID=A0ACB9K365_9ASTR|nr:hypothetical protein L1987_00739 [Smallanthus sonchifolius]